MHPDQAPVSALASPLSMVGDPPRPSYIQPQPHIPSCWPRRCAASFCPKGALARSDLFSAISWFLFFRFGTLFSDFCPATESPYPPFPEERTLLFGKIILFFLCLSAFWLNLVAVTLGLLPRGKAFCRHGPAKPNSINQQLSPLTWAPKVAEGPESTAAIYYYFFRNTTRVPSGGAGCMRAPDIPPAGMSRLQVNRRVRRGAELLIHHPPDSARLDGIPIPRPNLFGPTDHFFCSYTG